MVRGAGKTEDGLVRYNEKVNKLGDDLRELYETIRGGIQYLLPNAVDELLDAGILRRIK